MQDLVFDNLKKICSEQEECIINQEKEIKLLKDNKLAHESENTEEEAVSKNAVDKRYSTEREINSLKIEIEALRNSLTTDQAKLIKLEGEKAAISNKTN